MDIRCFLAVEKVADPNATVAVRLAGTYPYFSKRVCVDLLGKCDPYIANMPAYSDISRAGHNKFDYTYSLTTYKPDIILHIVGIPDDVFNRLYRPVIVEVDGTEMTFCVRRDSPVSKKCKTASWPEIEKCFLKMDRQAKDDF